MYIVYMHRIPVSAFYFLLHRNAVAMAAAIGDGQTGAFEQVSAKDKDSLISATIYLVSMSISPLHI